MTYSHPTRSSDICTLAVMDPPWRIGISNPTKGVTLHYPTLSLNKFKKITLPLVKFPNGSLLFIWPTALNGLKGIILANYTKVLDTFSNIVRKSALFSYERKTQN
eukprot:snap_masked-scaffold_23-processed-gene-0.42-mRNA-1 protein AED:1.00 eAED:1.00 QI:0/0/0/0/1/1/2/0/104